MPESARTRMLRWGFNLFPAYWATGARIQYIARDFREIRVRLPLSLRTRNYVGTIFGGSMYAAVDPVYMLMLIHTLGPEYVVWDKSASIRFRRPGRSTLFARFALDEAELEAIRAATAGGEPTDRVYRVELVDAAGVVHAEVEKTVYVRRRDAMPRERAASAPGTTGEG
jgi:acyl-coenzyme A thioesterase PaaI-like protein